MNEQKYPQKGKLQDQEVHQYSWSECRKMKPNISLYYPIYQNLIAVSDHNTRQLIQHNIQRLFSEKICYNSDNFAPQFQLIVLNQTQNSKVINVSVSFLYFTFEISILNLRTRTIFQKMTKSAVGGNANIYIYTSHRKNKLAIKSIRTSHSKQSCFGKSIFNLPKSLRDAIKEYCLSKLFSVLKVGPKVCNNFGFDLVILKSSVLFCLQCCSTYNKLKIEPLKRNMKIMHDLNIIHGDIKPDNIMWSQQQQNFVFIDFGLSDVLLEKPSEMTYTCFFGTLGFSYPEMQKLFTEKSFGYVDLYYNDAFALHKASINDQFKQVPVHRQSETQENKAICSFVDDCFLARLIYDADYEGVVNFLDEKSAHKASEEIKQLFKVFPPSKKLHQIFCLLAKKGILSNQSENLTKSYLFLVQFSQEYELSKERAGLEQCLVKDTHAFFIMYTLYIVYGQDTTLRAVSQKEETKQALRDFTGTINLRYCELLLYVANLYTTEEQILQALSSTKKLISINKYSNQQQSISSLYYSSFQIAVCLSQYYSLNILQIYEIFLQRRAARAKSESLKQFDVWKYKLCTNPNLFNFRSYNEVQNLYESKYWQYYPFSKCMNRCRIIENYEEETRKMGDYQTCEILKQQRFNASINYCFDARKLFFFVFSQQIQTVLAKDSNNQDLSVLLEEIQLFFKHFMSLKGLQVFMQIISHSVLKSECLYEMNGRWVRNVVTLFELFESLFLRQIERLHISFLFLTVMYSFYYLLLKIPQVASKSRIRPFLQKQDKWVEWKEQKYSDQQKISFLKTKISVLSRFNIITRKAVGQLLAQMSDNQRSLNKISKIQMSLIHLTLMKAEIQTIKQAEYENHLLNIKDLMENLTLVEQAKFMRSLSCLILPLVQFYYGQKRQESFSKVFDFIVGHLKVYQNLRQNKIEQQFYLYSVLRTIVELQLKKDSPFLIGSLYIYELNKLEQKTQAAAYANLIVIFEVVLSEIHVGQLKSEIYKALFMRILKIALKLVGNAQSFIKRTFTKKYFTLLLSCQQWGFQPGILNISTLLLKQFRNCQYPFEDRIKRILVKMSEKESKKVYNILKKKLLSWNSNKKKELVLHSNALGSVLSAKFKELISEGSLRTVSKMQKKMKRMPEKS